MTCCMVQFIGERPTKLGVDESTVYAKDQPGASCIFLVELGLACFVKGEEVICQRACKGSVVKRGSLPMNAFCVKLHTCIMKMAILKKPLQKWSIVPGRPSAKLCRKQKTGVLCVFQSFPICVLDFSATSPGKYACSLVWKI